MAQGNSRAAAYSLAHTSQRGFEVIDHANADERRPVRTLSGGETFLASLSLALALADQVAVLASTGAARLESMFLDEGFGSLDPETLDTVAAALEELGSTGRTLGIVTHVPALAEPRAGPVPGYQGRVDGPSRTSRVMTARRIAIETWNPDYGTPVAAGVLDPPDVSVDAHIELDPVAWKPMTPAPDATPPGRGPLR